jgi:hypothetical protein
MNYLINEGYQKAAFNFAKEAGIQPQVDMPAMDERINIRNDIHCGNIQSAIERINCLHPEVSNPRILFSSAFLPRVPLQGLNVYHAPLSDLQVGDEK